MCGRVGASRPFIAGLAFADRTLLDAAKVAILDASTISGVTGWLLLRRIAPAPASRPAASEAAEPGVARQAT